MFAVVWSWSWPILTGTIGVLIGWAVLTFFGTPIARFKDMRRDIERARINLFLTPMFTGPAVTAAGVTHPSILQMEAAKAELRRLAIDMMAFGAAEPAAIMLKWFGYDAKKIGSTAASFANFADAPITERLERDKQLRAALRIPD